MKSTTLFFFFFKFHLSPQLSPPLFSSLFPSQKNSAQKYGFTAGKKSKMEYGGQQNWRRIGGAPEAHWRRPKISSSTALSQWIGGLAVIRGFLRSVKFQMCAILAHPKPILSCASLKRKIPRCPDNHTAHHLNMFPVETWSFLNVLSSPLLWASS